MRRQAPTKIRQVAKQTVGLNVTRRVKNNGGENKRLFKLVAANHAQVLASQTKDTRTNAIEIGRVSV